MNKPNFSNQPSSLRVASRIGERMAVGMQRVLANTAIRDLAQAHHEYTVRGITLTEAQAANPQPLAPEVGDLSENQ